MVDRDRSRAALLGHALANSLCARYEGITPEEALDTFGTDDYAIVGGRLQLGIHNDDLYSMICVAESLCETGVLSSEDILQRLAEWYVGGETSDVGVTLQRTIERYLRGTQADQCGETGTWAAGNGALTRVLPVAIRYFDMPASELSSAATAVCRLTHDNAEAIGCVTFYAACLRVALDHDGPADSCTLDQLPEELRCVDPDSVAELAQMALPMALRHLGTTGYVVHTLRSGLYLSTRVRSFRELCGAAVLAGGDCDTIATVAGAIYGARHGMSQLPGGLLGDLEVAPLLVDIADELVYQ